MSKNTFPSYKKPPVDEVVCGLKFKDNNRIKIPHVGFLWDKFRKEYPNLEHMSPIADLKGEIPLDYATKLPIPRVWFVNDDDDQLIQFQSNRFYFNWRHRKRQYPRYNYVFSNFTKAYNSLNNLYEEFNLGTIKPIEYELTYVNRILQGEGWSDLEEISYIFNDFGWKPDKDRFLKNPDNLLWHAEFSLPEDKGILSVSLKKAVRKDDNKQLLLFELKTRGMDESEKGLSIDWFNLAHEWIVKGFTDLTTSKMHKMWGRENA
jgi:uncharacterized protein (TIGR04255 family)